MFLDEPDNIARPFSLDVHFMAQEGEGRLGYLFLSWHSTFGSKLNDTNTSSSIQTMTLNFLWNRAQSMEDSKFHDYRWRRRFQLSLESRHNGLG